jgi:NADH-quinone oxidoreductase subunit E
MTAPTSGVSERVIFVETSVDSFERLLEAWRGQKGNVIPLLQKTQELRGFLSNEDMAGIARATGKSPAEIYGVATFYAQFRFQPAGRHTLKVCHGTACHVNGAESLDTTLKMELGIEAGATTEDGEFSRAIGKFVVIR